MENNKALALLKENELIKLAKDRNSAAFEELVKRNQARIYNLGLKLLGNKEDAADLLQETFINAYYALPKFEGKSAFSTWLYRIATNNAFMKMRKRKFLLSGLNKKIMMKMVEYILQKLLTGQGIQRHIYRTKNLRR